MWGTLHESRSRETVKYRDESFGTVGGGIKVLPTAGSNLPDPTRSDAFLYIVTKARLVEEAAITRQRKTRFHSTKSTYNNRETVGSGVLYVVGSEAI
jgi:hypothetical protein